MVGFSNVKRIECIHFDASFFFSFPPPFRTRCLSVSASEFDLEDLWAGDVNEFDFQDLVDSTPQRFLLGLPDGDRAMDHWLLNRRSLLESVDNITRAAGDLVRISTFCYRCAGTRPLTSAAATECKKAAGNLFCGDTGVATNAQFQSITDDGMFQDSYGENCRNRLLAISSLSAPLDPNDQALVAFLHDYSDLQCSAVPLIDGFDDPYAPGELLRTRFCTVCSEARTNTTECGVSAANYLCAPLQIQGGGGSNATAASCYAGLFSQLGSATGDLEPSVLVNAAFQRVCEAEKGDLDWPTVVDANLLCECPILSDPDLTVTARTDLASTLQPSVIAGCKTGFTNYFCGPGSTPALFGLDDQGLWVGTDTCSDYVRGANTTDLVRSVASPAADVCRLALAATPLGTAELVCTPCRAAINDPSQELNCRMAAADALCAPDPFSVAAIAGAPGTWYAPVVSDFTQSAECYAEMASSLETDRVDSLYAAASVLTVIGACYDANADKDICSFWPLVNGYV